jgi:4a-hydroxytetrahydrobiopterin dehydratase
MGLAEKKCVPCEGGTLPLTETEENRYNKIVRWEIDRTGIHKIRKIYTFNSFGESIEFVNNVAAIAEQEQHHPEIHISFRKVIIELHTHTVLGLSENDYILASKIDKIAKKEVINE